HDIGMVALPDHLLQEQGRLTPQDRIFMQAHTTLGAEALQEAAQRYGNQLGFLRMAIEIARHHHERFDGTGYPDGLAGNAIPLSARLVALADVYDALRSRRALGAAPLCWAVGDDVSSGKGLSNWAAESVWHGHSCPCGSSARTGMSVPHAFALPDPFQGTIMLHSFCHVVLVDPAAGSRAAIRNMMQGMEWIFLAAELADYGATLELVAQSKPDGIIVNLDADPAKGLPLIDRV